MKSGQEAKDLEKRVSPEGLIIPEKFNVKSVYCRFIPTEYGEIVMGGEGWSRETGYVGKTILEVEPFNKEVPIKRLYFMGFSSVRAGDVVEAKIPKYKKVIEEYLPGEPPEDYKYYIPKDKFDEEERAIEISILNGDRIVRTERAADYEE